jgi:hypothetical protein
MVAAGGSTVKLVVGSGPTNADGAIRPARCASAAPIGWCLSPFHRPSTIAKRRHVAAPVGGPSFIRSRNLVSSCGDVSARNTRTDRI